MDDAGPQGGARPQSIDMAELTRLVETLLRRTNEKQHPVTNAAGVALRDVRHAYWNTKVFGSYIARQLYAEGRAGNGVPAPSEPVGIDLGGRICCQGDIESDWLRYWCKALGVTPVYHRKVWEDCYVPQAIWEAGHLKPGKKALGFAVGTELLPSLLASRGVSVLATDLESTDQRSAGWRASNQHSSNLNDLFRPHLVSRTEFDERVTFQPLDMNAVPEALFGQFDICWSVCSLEHLGSIEKGLRFIERSVKCLAPGGIAVHTTEFNIDSDSETIDDWGTVLFQRKHFEDLGRRLAADGHRLLPIDYGTGEDVLDQFVDLPPFIHHKRAMLNYPRPPHLRLSVDGFVVTSIGIIIRAAG